MWIFLFFGKKGFWVGGVRVGVHIAKMKLGVIFNRFKLALLENLRTTTPQLAPEPPNGPTEEAKAQRAQWCKLMNVCRLAQGATSQDAKDTLILRVQELGVSMFYRPAVRFVRMFPNTDIKPKLIKHVEDTATRPFPSGNPSFAYAVYQLCPQVKDLIIQVLTTQELATQEEWANIHIAGNGPGSRPGRKLAAKRRREETGDELEETTENTTTDDDAAAAAAGGGAGAAPAEDTAPPSAKKAKTTTSTAAPVVELQEHQECTICMNAKKDTLVLPCGHLTTCPTCAPKEGELCPVCRGAVEKTVKVYF